MPNPATQLAWMNRRRTKFHACLHGFRSQFQEWKDRTEQSQWSTHYTQVRAIEALLVGVSDEVAAAAREAESDPSFANDLPEFERAMLSGWRVWEFFRSKLAQRMDEQFQPGLRAADELAWACRSPLAATATTPVPKEPALVFLSGNASPIALARGRKFWAEAQPGMAPLDESCEKLLKHVPVPLISLPWHEIWHIPSLTAVAHEAGHIVEEDFGLTGDLNEALRAAVGQAGGTAAEAETWLRWRAEVFADFFAVRHCGPAFVGMLGDLLANVGTLGPEYPPASVRMELCFAGLKQMGLDVEAKQGRTQWEDIVGTRGAGPDLQAVPRVIDQLAGYRMGNLGGRTLGELVVFDQARLERALKIKEDLKAHRRPERIALGSGGDEGVPQLLAVAARLLYEEDPRTFSDEASSLDVIDLIASVNAGQRRGARRSIGQAAVSGESLRQSAKAAAAVLLPKRRGPATTPAPTAPDLAPADPPAGAEAGPEQRRSGRG